MDTLKCSHCGLMNFSTDETCERCQQPLHISPEPQIDSTPHADPIIAAPQPNPIPPPILMPPHNGITRVQGYVIIALLVLGLGLLSWSVFKPQPKQKYEYKVINYLTESNQRSGEGALKFSYINISEAEIASMGAEGWELVGTFLEMETAFTNFGKPEYVTGLQPNVRPQRAVLIFKRQAK